MKIPGTPEGVPAIEESIFNGVPIGNAEATLQSLAQAGIDIDALAKRLQQEGAASFVESWNQLLERIDDKRQALAGAGR